MLSVEQIAVRLERDFYLLTSGSRAALPRHQTLKALIDWSYHLLSPDERALLLGLSVFAGGWTMEAAEAVCADPEGHKSAPVLLQSEQIVELTGHLIDKSLIRFEPASTGEPRYSMLETVRHYSQEKLAERGEADLLRERHLDYYLSLVQAAEPHLRAFGAKDWLDRLERELDNLRMALEWSLRGSIEKGLQTATALFWLWWIRGHAVEGAGWLIRLLEEQTNHYGSLDTAGKVARGRALNVLFDGNFIGVGAVPDSLSQQRKVFQQESQAIFEELGQDYQRDLAISRGNQLETIDKLEEVLECRRLFLEVKDPFRVKQIDMGLAQCYPPDDERSVFYTQEGLALSKEIGDLDGEAWFLAYMGWIEFCRGNIASAVKLKKEAIACFELIGNREWAARHRGALVYFYFASGDDREALEQLEMVRTMARELHSHILTMRCLQYQAYSAWMKREDALAVRYCEDAEKLHRDFPGEIMPLCYYVLGRVALSQGDLARAERTLLEYIKDYGTLFWDARFIQALGVLAVKVGQMQRAALLFGAQDAWSMKIISALERSEYEQAVAAARTALGEEAFTTSWEAGRAMTPEQVVHYVLEEGFNEVSNHQ